MKNQKCLIVFQEITKEIAVSFVVKIKVTEKDLVFSDTGCVKETISLDLTQNLKEQKIITLQIEEKGRILKKAKIGLISFEFEIIVR